MVVEAKVREAVDKCTHEWEQGVCVPYCLRCGVDFEFWMRLSAEKGKKYVLSAENG